MPKTQQSAVDRAAQVANKTEADTRRIVDTSPDSESKDQMISRVRARERAAYGDIQPRNLRRQP